MSQWGTDNKKQGKEQSYVWFPHSLVQIRHNSFVNFSSIQVLKSYKLWRKFKGQALLLFSQQKEQ